MRLLSPMRGLLAWRSRRERAEDPGLFHPARRMGALDRPLQVGAEQPGKPVDCERRHCGFAVLGEIGCQLAGDLDHAKARARHVGMQGRRQGNASVIWRDIHSAVGFVVTPNDTHSRRP
jgi:hypothetical protein